MVPEITHAEWCQHLAELGALKESHNGCLTASTCVAGPDMVDE